LFPKYVFFEKCEVLTAVKIQVEVFWVVTPCAIWVSTLQRSMLKDEDGGSMDIRNVGFLPQRYTASQPRRPRFEYTLHVISTLRLETD
jgi:hypothetical protein